MYIKNDFIFFVPFSLRLASKFAKSANFKKINMGIKKLGILC